MFTWWPLVGLHVLVAGEAVHGHVHAHVDAHGGEGVRGGQAPAPAPGREAGRGGLGGRGPAEGVWVGVVGGVVVPRPLLRPPLLLAVHCVLLPALVTLHTQMACSGEIVLE